VKFVVPRDGDHIQMLALGAEWLVPTQDVDYS
jgi:hypothetical protein